MLSEKLGKVSDCAIVGSVRVAVKPIIEIGSDLDGGEIRMIMSSETVRSSLSIVGRKRRITKTLLANLNLGFQKGI